MTLDDQRAIEYQYRCFAAHLIVSSIAVIRNQRSAVSDAYDAENFLQSDTCIYLVRLLGIGDGLSDEEIALMLMGAIQGRGITPDRP